jgi:hypothetical protein
VIRARAVVGLLTVGVLIALTPIAYADPPDPTWLTGYWDDDDFDNATEFITDACAIEVASPLDIGPLFAPVASLGPEGTADWVVPLRSVASARAPPAEPAAQLLIANP